MKLALAAIATFALIANSSAEKIPDSLTWQPGIISSATSENHARVAGYYYGGSGNIRTRESTVTHYKVEGQQYVYETDWTTDRHNGPLDVTLNAPMTFAVQGMCIYLRDGSGKIHKMGVDTKELKPSKVTE